MVLNHSNKIKKPLIAEFKLSLWSLTQWNITFFSSKFIYVYSFPSAVSLVMHLISKSSRLTLGVDLTFKQPFVVSLSHLRGKKEKQKRKWPLFCFWGAEASSSVGKGSGPAVGFMVPHIQKKKKKRLT